MRSLAPHDVFSKQFIKLSFLCDNLTSTSLQPRDWKLESCKNATSNARGLLEFTTNSQKKITVSSVIFAKQKNPQNLMKSPRLGLAGSAGRRGQGTTSAFPWRFSYMRYQSTTELAAFVATLWQWQQSEPGKSWEWMTKETTNVMALNIPHQKGGAEPLCLNKHEYKTLWKHRKQQDPKHMHKGQKAFLILSLKSY